MSQGSDKDSEGQPHSKGNAHSRLPINWSTAKADMLVGMVIINIKVIQGQKTRDHQKANGLKK